MRRFDRAIPAGGEIFSLLMRCDTLRLGLVDGEEAYIVPVSFGAELQNGAICVFFHGSFQGRKAALLQSSPRVCVEADLCHGFLENGAGGYTCDYESVIGWGTVELLYGEAAARGVRLLMAHCGFFEYTNCPPDVARETAVYRITLDRVSGKRRGLSN